MTYPNNLSRKEQIFYARWVDMKTRCNNSNRRTWENYGGRGITYDISWDKYSNFKKDMFNSFEIELTLDRIDSNGNYCKHNCRWATMEQQQNNRRNNRKILHKGLSLTLSQWSKRLGIKTSTLYQRYHAYNFRGERLFKEV